MARAGVAILGIYAADLQFTAPRQPVMGETVLGTEFAIGPGGKGSNQAVAAARAGAKTTLISRVGRDTFGDAARAMWQAEGIATLVTQDEQHATGAAYIFLEQGSGANAVLVVPGAAGQIGSVDIAAARDTIEASAIFLTQFETPVAVAVEALALAKAVGVITILNPAPAAKADDTIFRLCDYCTPNESEAEALTGIAVNDLPSARAAAEALLAKGVGTAIITLGANGALFHGKEQSLHIPAFVAGKVVDTTGAGDAFNGSFAAALSLGAKPPEAARFACAAAGISVTRHGTAPSMPHHKEIQDLLK